ncbi:MAG: hypothetical protein IKG18_07630 [Atopobiaceae bacterium]|nr:hypothetical protein [Atopobiaceae bacterium]
MKNYTMTVAKSDIGKDVFRLCDEGAIVSEISLGKNEGATELKEMFSKLLAALIEDEVSVTYVDTAGYTVGMYKDVCRAYVKVLQGELDKASQAIQCEGLR